MSSKKKCDQLKPVCSRCIRLRLPCTGAGVQRFKFKQVVIGEPQTTVESKHFQPRKGVIASGAIIRDPNSATTALANALIEKLQVRDPRYDLCWAYGGLLNELPRRLGTNAALDASVSAMVTIVSHLGDKPRSPEVFSAYGKALVSLKTCLHDPIAVQSSSTLCAIYLIWICQAWVSNDEDMVFTGHSSGIIKLLSRVSQRKSVDEFDHMVHMTIAAPVIFERLVDPTIQLNSWLLKLLIATETPVIPDDDDGEGIGDLPNQPRRSQVGLIFSSVLAIADFMRYDPTKIDEIAHLHRDMQRTCVKLREKMYETLDGSDEKTFLDLPKHPRMEVTVKRLHDFYQKIYGLFLSLEVMLNAILQAYHPEDATLQSRNFEICQEIVWLSYAAQGLKPLGAGMIPVCLTSAWAATSDFSSRVLLEKTWSECWAGVFNLGLKTCGRQSAEIYERLRRDIWNANARSTSPVTSLEIERATKEEVSPQD
ncbi:hypothetical protein LTR84_000302 [Exophiala bonariae]|uniref:Zn(2)-C6 fungal-type domain-containing protein n=1 Tax=Exophiala bonariae TaxID=1690606 RepID=A0AAV9NQ46_9EURO|nr:hypothetical protein LTR84_000302 [Exophiala bonariae]